MSIRWREAVSNLTLATGVKEYARAFAPIRAILTMLVVSCVARTTQAQNAPLPAYLYDVVRYNAPFIIAETQNYGFYSEWAIVWTRSYPWTSTAICARPTI